METGQPWLLQVNLSRQLILSWKLGVRAFPSSLSAVISSMKKPEDVRGQYLVNLAHQVGIDRAIELLYEEMAKSIIKRYKITSPDQLVKGAEIPLLLSPTDRQLVLSYLNKKS